MRNVDERVEVEFAHAALTPSWRSRSAALVRLIVLFRFPRLLLAVAAAAVVVGVASAAGPAFISSARNASLEGELARLDDYAAGLRADTLAAPEIASVAEADAAVRAELARIDGLAPAQTAFVSSPLAIGEEGRRVRFVARTGYADEVALVTGSAGGALLPVGLAEATGLGPGDTVAVSRGDDRTELEVSGTYRVPGNATTAADAAGLPAYWRPFADLLLPTREPPLGVPPPPAVLLDHDRYLELASALADGIRVTWVAPLADRDLDHGGASRLGAQYRAFDRRANNRDGELGGRLAAMRPAFGTADVTSGLDDAVARVDAASVVLAGSVGLLTVAAQLIALLVVAAAGVFIVRSRRTEVRRAFAQGVAPSRQGLRGAAEAVVPVAVGAAAGWFLAIRLVRSLGPSAEVDAAAAGDAVIAAGLAAAAAIVLVGVVTAVAARSASDIAPERARGGVARLPWEVAVLAFAGVAFYEIASRGSTVVATDGAPRIDAFMVAFPFLFLAGVAGLGTRLAGRLLPRLGSVGGGWPTPLHLAARRLASAGGAVLALLTAVAVAVGVAAYAATVVASTSESLAVKSTVRVGSETAVRILSRSELDVAALPFPATRVVRLDATTRPQATDVTVLAVDPSTFAEAVLWHDRIHPSPIADLVAALEAGDGGEAPVLVVGGELDPVGAVLSPNFDLPYRTVEVLSAFPGWDGAEPLVVVDRAAVAAAPATAGDPDPLELVQSHHVWAAAGRAEVHEALRAQGAEPLDTTTAAEIRSTPALSSLRWTFTLFAAIGALAVVLALVGILLYLQARQADTEVAYVLGRRMGLRRGQHLLAVVAELAGLVAAAAAVGLASGIAAAWILNRYLDPLPGLPPAAVFAVPWRFLGIGLVVLAAACALGAALVQRGADRARVAEVLRLAR